MGLCTHSSVGKCLVQIEESVLLQVVCTGSFTCVKHTLNCTKKIDRFFCERLEGGVMTHVSGGRGFVWSFKEWRCELSSGLSQPRGKSC